VQTLKALQFSVIRAGLLVNIAVARIVGSMAHSVILRKLNFTGKTTLSSAWPVAGVMRLQYITIWIYVKAVTLVASNRLLFNALIA
jgi:hypothetical protein